MTLSPFIHDIFFQQLFDLFLPHFNIYGLTNLILSLDSDYAGDDYIGCGVINCAKNPWLNRGSLLGKFSHHYKNPVQLRPEFGDQNQNWSLIKFGDRIQRLKTLISN